MRGDRAIEVEATHLAAREADAVRADYVVTESGGVPIPTASGPRLPLTISGLLARRRWARRRPAPPPARRRPWASG
jgi:hypothetical protein